MYVLLCDFLQCNLIGFILLYVETLMNFLNSKVHVRPSYLNPHTVDQVGFLQSILNNT